MVEAGLDVRRQRVLAGVTSRTVAAVVPQGDGLGEGDVEPRRLGQADRHLGDLDGVREPGPLVVLGEDEHLRLAGQAPEGGGVEDAVAVPLEAGAVRVGVLGP